jgi:hypothetical protein
MLKNGLNFKTKINTHFVNLLGNNNFNHLIKSPSECMY